jgi:hypothetical protein
MAKKSADIVDYGTGPNDKPEQGERRPYLHGPTGVVIAWYLVTAVAKRPTPSGFYRIEGCIDEVPKGAGR